MLLRGYNTTNNVGLCSFMWGERKKESQIRRVDRDIVNQRHRPDFQLDALCVIWINMLMPAACTVTDMSTNQNYNSMSARCKGDPRSVTVPADISLAFVLHRPIRIRFIMFDNNR